MNDSRLVLKRKWFTEKSTVGELYFDGEFQCFTLEDKVREVKIPKETAIPAGTYEIAMTWSNRFKKLMPLLLHVPDFEAIRIHNGNTKDQTDGCILVGDTRSQDFVGNSVAAFAVLKARIDQAMHISKVFIEILNCKNEAA